MHKRTLIAERSRTGSQVWAIPYTEITLEAEKVGGWVDVHYKGEFVFGMAYRDASNAFAAWLYPSGSVVYDESDAAKRLRKMEVEGKFDIPRQEISYQHEE
jgi:hypothetical protein|tara:strand:- start:1320 stop:1622 length:303 start_codon:yes stop_codon:yes gene_type:complete